MDSSLALGACDWLYGGVVWPVLISGVAGSFDGIRPTHHRPTQSSVTHLRYSYALRPLSDTAWRWGQVDRACFGEPGRRGRVLGFCLGWRPFGVFANGKFVRHIAIGPSEKLFDGDSWIVLAEPY